MKIKPKWGFFIAGFCAGAVNGMFGAAGGMVLVPLLTALTDLEENLIFPVSISIIAPICVISLAVTLFTAGIDFHAALPYLIGGAAGGTAAGFLGRKIPVTWLHRALGILIVWGGIRYLC